MRWYSGRRCGADRNYFHTSREKYQRGWWYTLLHAAGHGSDCDVRSLHGAGAGLSCPIFLAPCYFIADCPGFGTGNSPQLPVRPGEVEKSRAIPARNFCVLECGTCIHVAIVFVLLPCRGTPSN